MRNIRQSPKNNCRLILPGYYQKYLNSFVKNLSSNGYSEFTISCYRGPVKHFCIWLHKKSIPLTKVTDHVIFLFSKHNCRCSGNIREGKRSSKYIKRVRNFVFYLIHEKFILDKNNSSKIKLPSLLVKYKKSLHCRGLSNITIMHYERSIIELLPALGNDPKKYNPAIIRQVVYCAAKKNSLPATKKLTTALRSYLRFLTMEKKCHPDLDATVPTVAQWKLSSLPKYITTKEVERVIASCDVNTKIGLRDKAIILFLARLGLRAGDIINMLIDDINWKESTVRVRGKGRREAVLPLTQEVGDALLAYIKKSRPQVSIDQVFLCFNAPHRPFPFSSDISNIVSAAISRAQIIDPPSRGASLLRHSAATTMLRNGATLETVSAVLRHRSLDMTSYYAKVDIRMLTKIAQPWPEGAHHVK
jgi:integrase/recombinase XerD